MVNACGAPKLSVYLPVIADFALKTRQTFSERSGGTRIALI